jgi:hypothetical protein
MWGFSSNNMVNSTGQFSNAKGNIKKTYIPAMNLNHDTFISFYYYLTQLTHMEVVVINIHGCKD